MELTEVVENRPEGGRLDKVEETEDDLYAILHQPCSLRHTFNTA